jgi:DNA/RNA-binding domain of Phe-tRNA-synthetase-like protein
MDHGMTDDQAPGTEHDPPLALPVEEHPLLRVAGFVTRFPAPLAELGTPAEVLRLLALDAPAPLQRDETVRADVRDMLRHGGYKPTGRGKPASEYLVRTAGEGALGSINLAVDACNAVSLHSGFPVSVVDLGLATAPFRVATAPAGAAYVFHPSGQEIDLGGLVCLWDSAGACANAVRDAQRTKTHPETVSTLSVIWGAAAHETRLREAERWYRALLEDAGARTFPVS